jgi:hypothetical protein
MKILRKKMKLTIELVPASSYYNNVRSNVSGEVWNEIRKKSYEFANYKCEICGDTGFNQGYNHSVECHEIWNYDDKNKIQKLIGFISLCPLCHKVKHIGLARVRNEYKIALNHLIKINKITENKAEKYIDKCFDIWNERSQEEWLLDISYIDNYNKSEYDILIDKLKNLKC